MKLLLIWFFKVINCYSQFQEFSQDDLDFVCSELKEWLFVTDRSGRIGKRVGMVWEVGGINRLILPILPIYYFKNLLIIRSCNVKSQKQPKHLFFTNTSGVISCDIRDITLSNPSNPSFIDSPLALQEDFWILRFDISVKLSDKSIQLVNIF